MAMGEDPGFVEMLQTGTRQYKRDAVSNNVQLTLLYRQTVGMEGQFDGSETRRERRLKYALAMLSESPIARTWRFLGSVRGNS